VESEADVSPETVRTCLKRLRRKIDSEKQESLIQTFRGGLQAQSLTRPGGSVLSRCQASLGNAICTDKGVMGAAKGKNRLGKAHLIYANSFQSQTFPMDPSSFCHPALRSARSIYTLNSQLNGEEERQKKRIIKRKKSCIGHDSSTCLMTRLWQCDLGHLRPSSRTKE